MEKVYSDGKCLWVSDLQDIYYIKCLDKNEQKEYYEIVTWTRMVDLSDLPDKSVRKYDIEFNDKKYFFLLYSESDRFILKSENSYEITELCSEKNIELIPDNKNYE